MAIPHEMRDAASTPDTVRSTARLERRRIRGVAVVVSGGEAAGGMGDGGGRTGAGSSRTSSCTMGATDASGASRATPANQAPRNALPRDFRRSTRSRRVTTNLPSYAEEVGAGAFMIGLVIAVYDFAERFAKPAAGFVADRSGM